MRFADQVELLDVPLRTPGCLRFEIGTCLGPCVGAPTARAYNQQLREARAFLEGATEGPIVRLDVAMQAASAEWQFERAAILRDKKARLESLQERFSRLRFAVESLSFVYLVPGHAGEDRVYLVRRGVVRAEHAAPDRPEYLRRLPGFLSTFARARYVVDAIGELGGADVVARYRFEAEYEGTPIDIPGVMWFEVRNGLIARRTDLWDSLTFLRQTGQAD